jgi:ABC-type branched-subunit amino acid transport system substrate-binding protein
MRAGQRRLAAGIAVLAAMVTLAACGSDETSSGPQRLDLKIGNLVPRTGFLDPFGVPAQQAADLAADEIRKAAAKAGAQHKVTLTHVDYRSEPKVAVDASKKLVEAGSSCLVGPWAGGHVDRVATKVAIPEKVLEITPAASGDAQSKADDLGYLNRVVPPDRLQAHALVELLDEKLRGGARGKKVNVGALEGVGPGQQSTYAKELATEFEDAWTGKGGRIGRQETYRLDQPDIEDEVNGLASGDPDAWVFFDFAETYARVGNDLVNSKDSKFTPKRAFGTDSLANLRLVNLAPLATNGLRGVAISAPKRGDAAKEFDRRFTARGEAKRQTFDAQEFDAVVLCYLSAVAAGSTSGKAMAGKVRDVSAPPGRKFTWLQLDLAIKALEAGQDIDYEGASGAINMNDDGDPTAGVYDVYEFKGGKLRLGEQIGIPAGSGGI